ncbi:MAG TPA: PilT/PilU family type 4a pilus ATPase [Planctomycetota bacterium]|nr:PilT/PilU family type 4a pilus ATPase [Planctomycetota bacterium]
MPREPQPHVDDLLRQVVERSGSDLHLLDGLPPKVRVHGALEALDVPPPPVEKLLAPVLDVRHRAIFDSLGETDLAYAVEGAGRFRVNVFRHQGGIGAVFRLIPRHIPTLDELSLPPEVAHLADVRSGLVLVTGPTGSGKSSTLAALLTMINQREKRHVVTIEDPIEYVHHDVESTFTQREVGRDTESFAAALRSAARQDPDLLLVGEMRDKETIHSALTLAEMGMLVFSTLHTNSAGRTIDRIVEVFPEEQQTQIRSMLAESLQGVLSQILCRRNDVEGRVPATELLFTSTALKSVIREGAAHKIESMLQAGRAEGMHRMDDSLFQLASEGLIPGEEAYRKASDKARFVRFAREE